MRSALRLQLWVAVVVVSSGACRGEKITESEHEARAHDGSKLEDVHEVQRINAAGGTLVQQRHTMLGAPDAVMSLAQLDAGGFATGASYRREGPKGKRYVEFKRREDGKLVVYSRGDDETLLLPDLPVVDLEMLPHLKPSVADAKRAVVALDIENAVAVPATVDVQGHLELPPLQPLTATDPVLPMHTSRAPFIESQTAKVVKFCKQQASSSDGAVEAARKVALAVKPKLATDRAGGPPSAFWTEEIGAFDQGGAALVVACLRALDRPARVVTGVVEGMAQPKAARTWAEVNDGARWVDVDPLDIDVDGHALLVHTARVEGFPGPLTTERLQ